MRRIVDAAALPDLLGRETAAALLEAAAGDGAVVFVELPGGDVRVVAAAGCDADTARALARVGVRTASRTAAARSSSSRSAATRTGRASRCVASPRPIGHPVDAARCG